MKWNIRSELYYTKSHEWMREEDERKAAVGITDYAQDKLGEVVFVELPEEGKEVEKGESIAVIESVKAVVDSYAPVSGRVVEVNWDLEERPEALNEDPYGEGWIVKMEVQDKEEVSALMQEEQYREHVIKEEEEVE